MKITINRFVLATLTAFAVSGCASSYDVTKNNPPSGGDFARALHSGYIDLAGAERDEYDWGDGRNFTDRAAMAARGEEVLPEAIGARQLPADSVGMLTEARNRLMSAFGEGGREAAPEEAARAQVMFDCWMQEQEENRQREDIQACKDGFFAALRKVNKALTPPPPAPKVVEKPKPLPGDMVVYFDFNSVILSAEALGIIQKAADAIVKGPATGVTLRGHADRAGPQAYNSKLAEQRVEAVRQALIARGVSDSAVMTRAYGENKPARVTKDGVAEKRNRRVEFSFTR